MNKSDHLDFSFLPINECLPTLLGKLKEHNRVILEAMPGAGKTTVVPLAVHQAKILGQKKILMLEPRRIAARSTSNFMSQLLKENVGDTVGYSVRFEHFSGPNTKIEVVTEGILTKRLQKDPELSDIGLIIFDEFHERNLQSDLALTLTMDVQENLRDDLKILIMSATLDLDHLKSFFKNAPVVRGPESPYPVEVIHSVRDMSLDWFTPFKDLILDVLKRHEGNILVFLPGSGEILKLKKELENNWISEGAVFVKTLYGQMPKALQDEVLNLKEKPGHRFVILSTPIAETSVTIPGIKVVIDSGLSKVPFLDHDLGLTKLQLRKISKGQAKQRAGRAGRLSSGFCYRLWSEAQHNLLQEERSPEILFADLSSTVLEVANWEVPDWREMNWPTTPPIENFQKAEVLLKYLGCLNHEGKITAHGRDVLSLGIEPRLGHMVLKAKCFGLQSLAVDLTAYLLERDTSSHSRKKDQSGHFNSDLCLFLEALHDYRKLGAQAAQGLGVNPFLVKRVDETSRNLKKRFIKSLYQKQRLSEEDRAQWEASPLNIIEDLTGVVLGMAYTDRLAKRRNQNTKRYHLLSGKGATLLNEDNQAPHDFLAVGELRKKGKDFSITVSARVKEGQIQKYFGDYVKRVRETSWDQSEKIVTAFEYEKLGAITLKRYFVKDIGEEEKRTIFLEALKKDISLLPWDEGTLQWVERVMTVREWCPELNIPSVLEKDLQKKIDEWLFPFIEEVFELKDLRSKHLEEALSFFLGHEFLLKVDELAPPFFNSPTGRKVRIKYERGKNPILPIKINEMYGQTKTPTLCKGKVIMTIHLLNPAGRPVQITNRLEDFWKGSYELVRKELNRQYPKHDWPLDPLQRSPSSFSKQKKKKRD